MKRFRLGAQALALTCALIALPTTLSAAKPETRPAVSTAAIPTDYKEICNALPAKGLQHPYLVFNEAQKPAILEYIKTNKRAGDIYRMLQLEGERYLRVDADPAPAMNDIKSRFSGKDDHAAYQNYYQYGSVVCALLYQLTGDTAYANAHTSSPRNYARWIRGGSARTISKISTRGAYDSTG